MLERPLSIAIACLLGACGDDLGEARLAEAASDWAIVQVADTNGDGRADVIWASASTHRAAIWLMDGAHLLAAGPPIAGPDGEGWSAVTTGDFNRDGMNDLLWSQPSTSRAAVTLLHGARPLGDGPLVRGPPGDGWAVANAGDMNGDGMADILWYSPARHAAAVWLMDGAHVLAQGPELPEPPGDGWRVSNVTDMNQDGLADVGWNAEGPDRTTVWLMNGARLLASGHEITGPPGSGWSAPADADFNGDGMGDMLWTKPGRMIIWLMNGAEVLAIGPEIAGPGDDWQVANAGDTNGDGLADVVWQKIGASRMQAWLMNGTRVLARGPEIAGPD